MAQSHVTTAQLRKVTDSATSRWRDWRGHRRGPVRRLGSSHRRRRPAWLPAAGRSSSASAGRHIWHGPRTVAPRHLCGEAQGRGEVVVRVVAQAVVCVVPDPVAPNGPAADAKPRVLHALAAPRGNLDDRPSQARRCSGAYSSVGKMSVSTEQTTAMAHSVRAAMTARPTVSATSMPFSRGDSPGAQTFLTDRDEAGLRSGHSMDTAPAWLIDTIRRACPTRWLTSSYDASVAGSAALWASRHAARPTRSPSRRSRRS